MARGSNYLDSSYGRAQSRPRRFRSLASILFIFAIFLGTFASIPLLQSLGAKANSDSNLGTAVITDASAAWCASPKEGNLGSGMDEVRSWKTGSTNYPHSGTSNRTLTAQEAFGNGITFVNFNGAGESPGMEWLWMSPDQGLYETKGEDGIKSVPEVTGMTSAYTNWFRNMNDSRTPANCVFGGVGAGIANFVIGGTTGVTSLVGGLASFAFDPKFICQDSSQKNCFDLVGIIGGNGKSSDTGIIGKLTTSVYFPLLGLAALLVGIYVLINGIAKRQFRQTIGGVLWAVVIAFFGTILLLNPLFIAKAPMVVGNTIASCVVGTFSGSGACVESGPSTSASTTDQMCVATAPGVANPIDKASLTMVGMGCELWKAFVLQPYAQGSFGASLDELDTANPDSVVSQIMSKNELSDSAAKNFNNFCVDTKVVGKLDSYSNKTLKLTSGGNKICNLAVYQAYAGLAIDMDGTKPDSGRSVSPKWLAIATVAASDDGMYRSWAPTDMHFAQISIASVGLFSAGLSAIVIFVVAAFALAYYVTSLLLVAFAPFFLLAGIHPGKGKKLLIGWGGQVLSSLMKYIASAVFLVITVAIYSAVLSKVSNMGATLIFMIILTVALLMYRREIIDMLGIIDMGGEKLSNRLAEKTMDRVRNTGKTATAVSAGVAAGVLSNGVRNPFSAESRGEGGVLRQVGNVIAGMSHDVGNVLQSGADAGMRSLKSRPGVIGEVAKASDRISADNRQKMGMYAQDAQAAADADRNNLEGIDKEIQKLEDQGMGIRNENDERLDAVGDAQEIRDAQIKIDGVEANLNATRREQSAALSSIDNTGVRELHDLLNQARDLEIKSSIATAAGDLEAAAAIDLEISNLENRANAVLDTVSSEEIIAGTNSYNQSMADSLGIEGVDASNVTDHINGLEETYRKMASTLVDKNVSSILDEEAQAIESLTSEIAQSADRRVEASNIAENSEAAATAARDELRDLRPGQSVSNAKLRRQRRKIESERSGVNRLVRDSASAAALASDRRAESAKSAKEAHRETESMLKSSSKRIAGDLADIQQSTRALQEASRETASSWSSSEDSNRKNFAQYRSARSQANAAQRQIDSLSSRSELDSKQKSILDSARKEQQKALEEMEQKKASLAAAGADLRDLQQSFNREVGNAHNLQVSENYKISDGDLQSYQSKLEAARAKANEALREQEALEKDLKATAREAKSAAREASRASKTADRASQKAEERYSSTRQAGRADRSIQRRLARQESAPNRGIPTGRATDDQTPLADPDNQGS